MANELIFLTAYRVGATGDVDDPSPFKVVAIPSASIKKVTPVTSGKLGSIVHYDDGSGRQWKQIRVFETVAQIQAATDPASTNYYVANEFNMAVTAAGADQSGATALTKYLNNITTGTANQGVKLPAAAANLHHVIINATAANIKVYPNTSDKIDNGTANAAVDLAAGTRKHFVAEDAVNWVTVTDPND